MGGQRGHAGVGIQPGGFIGSPRSGAGKYASVSIPTISPTSVLLPQPRQTSALLSPRLAVSSSTGSARLGGGSGSIRATSSLHGSISVATTVTKGAAPPPSTKSATTGTGSCNMSPPGTSPLQRGGSCGSSFCISGSGSINASGASSQEVRRVSSGTSVVLQPYSLSRRSTWHSGSDAGTIVRSSDAGTVVRSSNSSKLLQLSVNRASPGTWPAASRNTARLLQLSVGRPRRQASADTLRVGTSGAWATFATQPSLSAAQPHSGGIAACQMAPGDVLLVQGNGGLMRLGTASGLMGHVMLVASWPQVVHKDSEFASQLEVCWPAGVEELYRMNALECSRNREGLHEADVLVFADPRTGVLTLLGEVEVNHVEVCNENVELWQPPADLRAAVTPAIIDETVRDMKASSSASWSWATAARALLKSTAGTPNDELFSWTPGDEEEGVLQEMRQSWATAPICTSVVISFWQRVICQVAPRIAEGSVRREASSGLTHVSMQAAPMVGLILRWMPCKADRSLPGTLVESMRRCGWTRRVSAT